MSIQLNDNDISSGYTCADIPLSVESKDSVDNVLGLTPHAKALVRFISKCATPMTIGLQGDWGSGKSSLMNLVESQLQLLSNASGSSRQIFLTVPFNTWKYSQLGQKDRLPILMMLNIIRKITAKSSEELKGTEWPSVETRQVLRKLGAGLLRALTIAAGGLATGSLAAAGASIDVGKVVGAFAQDEEQIADADLYEQLHQNFRNLVAHVIQTIKTTKKVNACRIVIFIDDLDRLEPVRAVEVLEVLKNFLDVPGCVFVLAIDYDVISRGLMESKRFMAIGEQDAEVKNFFDKIIQVPYRMPIDTYKSHLLLCGRLGLIYGAVVHGNALDSAAFGDSLATEVKCKRLLEHSISNNPRSVKRLLNLVALSAEIASVLREEDQRKSKLSLRQLDMVVILTAMQMAYLPAYRFLAVNRELGVASVLALCVVDDVCDIIDEGTEMTDKVAQERLEAVRRDWPEVARYLAREQDVANFVDAVQRLHAFVISPRNAKLVTSEAFRRHVPELAAMLLEFLDADRNGEVTPGELATYGAALLLASSSELSGDSGEAHADRVGRNILFRHLVKAELMNEDDELLLDPPADLPEGDSFVKVTPIVQTTRGILDVQWEGRTMTLRSATEAILQKLGLPEERRKKLTTASRERGLWVVVPKGTQANTPANGRSLSTLFDLYRKKVAQENSGQK